MGHILKLLSFLLPPIHHCCVIFIIAILIVLIMLWLTFYVKWQFLFICNDIVPIVKLVTTSETTTIFNMNASWLTIVNGCAAAVPVKKISVSPAATKILPKPMMLSSSLSGSSATPTTIMLTRPSGGTSNQCQMTSAKITAGSLVQGNMGKLSLTLLLLPLNVPIPAGGCGHILLY